PPQPNRRSNHTAYPILSSLPARWITWPERTSSRITAFRSGMKSPLYALWYAALICWASIPGGPLGSRASTRRTVSARSGGPPGEPEAPPGPPGPPPGAPPAPPPAPPLPPACAPGGKGGFDGRGGGGWLGRDRPGAGGVWNLGGGGGCLASSRPQASSAWANARSSFTASRLNRTTSSAATPGSHATSSYHCIRSRNPRYVFMTWGGR